MLSLAPVRAAGLMFFLDLRSLLSKYLPVLLKQRKEQSHAQCHVRDRNRIFWQIFWTCSNPKFQLSERALVLLVTVFWSFPSPWLEDNFSVKANTSPVSSLICLFILEKRWSIVIWSECCPEWMRFSLSNSSIWSLVRRSGMLHSLSESLTRSFPFALPMNTGMELLDWDRVFTILYEETRVVERIWIEILRLNLSLKRRINLSQWCSKQLNVKLYQKLMAVFLHLLSISQCWSRDNVTWLYWPVALH